MMIQLRKPRGTVLHTAGKKLDEEYDWSIKAGEVELFDIMANIHRFLLRDVGGESLRLAVLVQKQRIGFLIGDMPSPRRDNYANRIINNTLYLEYYATDDRANVLNYFANLLLCSKDQYHDVEKSFIDYAEWLYCESENRKRPPELAKLDENQSQNPIMEIKQGQWVLYNSPAYRQRCAAYLRKIAHSAMDTFCCVVTGRVSVERCQRVITEINSIQEFLILTLASEMEEKGELSLGETTIRKLMTSVEAIPIIGAFFRRK